MVLVDANILIDLFTNDPDWYDWSRTALLEAAAREQLGINPIIYAEVSIAFTDVAKLDAALAPLELVHCELPYAAGFLAEKAFLSIGVVRVVSTLLCLTFISVHMQKSLTMSF